MYDEYLNKYTYDSSTSVSVEPKKIGFLVREVIVTKMFIDEEDLGSDPERWESEAEEYFVDTPKEQFSDRSVEGRLLKMQRVTFKITEVKVYEHSVLMPRAFLKELREEGAETWDSINKLCNNSEKGTMVVHSEDQFVLEGISTIHGPLPKGIASKTGAKNDVKHPKTKSTLAFWSR